MPKRQDPSQDYIWGKRNNNKKWIIIGSAVGVVVIIIVGLLVFYPFDDTADSTDTTNRSTPLPGSMVRRATDGVMVPAGKDNHYPLAVMIENLTTSRPPSSLAKANVVYEALAEGGITRFLAIYSGERVELPEIGPVRSARPYYLDWALEYNALYVHVGGSPQALADIASEEVFDLNQFYNAQYFWRDTDRFAPHNVYTSGEKMAFALRDKEAPETGDFESWTFKNDPPLSERPTGEQSVEIEFSSKQYKVEYTYDREQNDYVRYLAEEVHRDKPPQEDVEGQAIRAKNVVIQTVRAYLVDDERLGMDTVGEGDVVVLRDGEKIDGTWKKDSRSGRTRFYTMNGEEIELTAGTTWVEIVPPDRSVTFY